MKSFTGGGGNPPGVEGGTPPIDKVSPFFIRRWDTHVEGCMGAKPP